MPKTFELFDRIYSINKLIPFIKQLVLIYVLNMFVLFDRLYSKNKSFKRFCLFHTPVLFFARLFMS